MTRAIATYMATKGGARPHGDSFKGIIEPMGPTTENMVMPTEIVPGMTLVVKQEPHVGGLAPDAVDGAQPLLFSPGRCDPMLRRRPTTGVRRPAAYVAAAEPLWAKCPSSGTALLLELRLHVFRDDDRDEGSLSPERPFEGERGGAEEGREGHLLPAGSTLTAPPSRLSPRHGAAPTSRTSARARTPKLEEKLSPWARTSGTPGAPPAWPVRDVI
ncbi:hypothetical protein MAPG_11362 [Magnaporthiopsis poae ATCC 64411]|uniref:Uncharacterized protein n=1 Tax=Magnaporthiopsis poae (strain ATCC 64411 / 73-15) TaxID=644358 RepID=A0A0C4EF27_MAGP6|nr:hypothetical protein MAPG_11362 [Magnaporthiopsis poae ATCC 64411]